MCNKVCVVSLRWMAGTKHPSAGDVTQRAHPPPVGELHPARYRDALPNTGLITGTWHAIVCNTALDATNHADSCIAYCHGSVGTYFCIVSQTSINKFLCVFINIIECGSLHNLSRYLFSSKLSVLV